MKRRYENWVEGLSWDWCISRQRFYGVPIPVWYCKKCSEIIVADEKQLPVDPLADKPSRDPAAEPAAAAAFVSRNVKNEKSLKRKARYS